MLHTETGGKGSPVVLLHGFTQSGASWGALARRLEASHRVVTVDLPGHGASAGVDADLWTGATMIAAAVDDAIRADVGTDAGGTRSAAWVGYSLGGRVALHVALSRPAAVSRLVLVSATAGIDDPAERAARRDADEVLAQRVERDGVEDFVRWWLARPLFATLPTGAAALDSRLGGSAAGLAASLRHAGTGTQQPLWDRLGALTMPVLVIAGALDDAYVGRARRLVDAIGANARLAIVDDAGHACHLEAPGAWSDLVEPFVATP